MTFGVHGTVPLPQAGREKKSLSAGIDLADTSTTE
jgi:hypothetical protein